MYHIIYHKTKQKNQAVEVLSIGIVAQAFVLLPKTFEIRGRHGLPILSTRKRTHLSQAPRRGVGAGEILSNVVA